MIDFLKKQLFTVHQNGKQQVSEVFKYIGPGIIVTVGFIDPGNWAANLAAGASYGYELLWVVTLSTIMLIFLQLYMTSSRKVMGQYANHTYTNVLLWGIGIVVTVMNIYLLIVG